MPSDSTTPSSNMTRHLLWGFLITWFVVNGAGTWFIRTRTDAGNVFLPHEARMASLSHSVDTLFLGNSFSSSAVQPSLLAPALTGWSGYNHSILVGGVSTAHMALNHWLRHKPAPRTIVWTLSHFEMSGKSSIVTMKFEQDGGLADMPWIFDSGPARGDLLQYLGRNLLAPAARDAPLWTQWLRHNAPGEADIGPDGAQPLNAGEADKEPVEGFEKTRSFYLNLMTNGFVRDAKTPGVIASFKKRCEALGIRLVILAPPTNSRHEALFHSAEDHAWAWEALQTACRDSGIPLWDLRQEFPDEDFADGVHLQKRVIPEFNRRLAERLRTLGP
ncbi:MAG: hypothetical protein AB7F75_06500 [Planctomycetota bacterium]